MNKISYFLKLNMIILILIFTSTNLVMAQPPADAFNRINLGSFRTYTESLTKEVIIFLPLSDPDLESIAINLEDGIFDSSNSRKLTGDRVKIQTQSMREPLFIDDKPIPIELQENIINENGLEGLFINLFFTAYPEDLPGLYEGRLVFEDENSQFDRLEMDLAFRIEPWLKLEETTGTHLITKTGQQERNLISDYPGNLKIYSNVDWELFVESEETLITNSTDLQLLINKANNHEFEIISDKTSLSDRKILLATGGPTFYIEEDYCELDFTLLIEDFTKVKAGQVRFPIDFRLEIIDFDN